MENFMFTFKNQSKTIPCHVILSCPLGLCMMADARSLPSGNALSSSLGLLLRCQDCPELALPQ